jgi:hypothetical protein
VASPKTFGYTSYITRFRKEVSLSPPPPVHGYFSAGCAGIAEKRCPAFESQQGKNFSPFCLVHIGPNALSPKDKWPGYEVEHSHPSSAYVTNTWRFTSTLPIDMCGSYALHYITLHCNSCRSNIVTTPGGKQVLGRPSRIGKDNTKMDRTEIGVQMSTELN